MKALKVDVEDLRQRIAIKFPPQPKKGGRPKGSKNREAVDPPIREHTDPTMLIEKQFTIAEWMQTAFAEELKERTRNDPRARATDADVERFTGITGAIARAVDTLRKADSMAEAMEERMSADQLLEAALRKIEASDARTVKYAYKRLRAHYDRLLVAPPETRDGVGTAVHAIASLGEEE